MLQRAGMIAPDGRCKTMDAAADGYVRAETCKAMYLMPAHMQGMTARLTVHPTTWHFTQLSAADRGWQPLLTKPAFSMLLSPLGVPSVARSHVYIGLVQQHAQPACCPCSDHMLDLDPPWPLTICVEIAGMNNDAPALGIILSSAVNTNGRSSALTAPHGPSQQGLLRAALQSAGLQPAHVAALQMHSNGTPLGDPIEVGAAAAVLLQVGFICNASYLKHRHALCQAHHGLTYVFGCHGNYGDCTVQPCLHKVMSNGSAFITMHDDLGLTVLWTLIAHTSHLVVSAHRE